MKMDSSISCLQEIAENKDRIVGLKQTLRAVQNGQVAVVYVANNVESHVSRRVADFCREKKVPMVVLDCDQKALGGICEIEVGAAVVALLKN